MQWFAFFRKLQYTEKLNIDGLCQGRKERGYAEEVFVFYGGSPYV